MPALLPSQFSIIVPFGIKPGLRTISNQYGSGYKQRAVDGINAEYETFDAKIVTKSDADAQTLDTFLKARATDPLVFQLPHYSSTRLYLVQQPFSIQYDGAGTYEFSFTMELTYL